MKIKIVSILLFLFVAMVCCVHSKKTDDGSKSHYTYVGTDKCQSCHPKEYKDYSGSFHFHAMDTASSASVKADFNNSYFVYFGDTAFFYKKGEQYFVKTTDSTSRKKEFLISYTFGWSPLQQYLVSFPDGRIQALPFCWDTRPKEKGGQRWFHIYNKEKILPKDELFWTGVNANWNNMCADCHTTNYFKNFDISSNTFKSSWTESRVSCESCHGPASGHMEWSKEKYRDDKLKGFAIDLKGDKASWKFDTAKGIAYPDKIVQNKVLIETCARCHSRSLRISDNYQHGGDLLNTHIPSAINSQNYYADGQIKEEDYEYGSFLQSKMHSFGVTCIHCHDPHTMGLKADGNKVCYSCHAPSKFDAPLHTHHLQNSAGAQCISCHMPSTAYMGNDIRYDHSIRIPRPDLSEKMGTPNACNKCHADRSLKWAADNFANWYGKKLAKKLEHTSTYPELLFNISKYNESSETDWNTLISGKYPGIIKATALDQFRFYSGRSIEQIKTQLQSKDANIRRSALTACKGLPAEVIFSSLLPLLSDPVLSVRTQALTALAPFYRQLEGGDKQRFETVLVEYMEMERRMSDRPEGYLNQGIILTATGRTTEAEQIYLLGIDRFPSFIQNYINLADLYRSQDLDVKARSYLDKGLAIEPKNAALHYSLALWQVRSRDKGAAMKEFSRAVQLAPSDAQYTYAYALALQDKGEMQKGMEVLEKQLAKYGNNITVLNGLISLCESSKMTDKVVYYSTLRKKVFGY